MAQQQVNKQTTTKEEVQAAPAKDIQDKGQTIKDEIDSLVDEIDDVLEKNAEEFIANFVQLGGE